MVGIEGAPQGFLQSGVEVVESEYDGGGHSAEMVGNFVGYLCKPLGVLVVVERIEEGRLNANVLFDDGGEW